VQRVNDAAQWRRELARRIAPAYAANPRVAAILLGGSSARGHADRYSDLEIGIFWSEPPTDEERRAPIEQVGGDLIRLYPFIPEEQVWCDDYALGRAAPDRPRSGLLVEAVHYTAAFMESALQDVLERYDPDFAKQNLIAGVQTGIPLYGAPLIERWQAAAAGYPDELVVAMIRTHAQIDHYWRFRMLLERDNPLMLNEILVQVAHQVLYMLLGLNRVYYSGFKWLDAVAERLGEAPPDLAARLRSVFRSEPGEGVLQLATLVEETYDLVECHAPAIDVERLREIFRYRRPEWEAPPPGLPGGENVT
jgi:hypothetical protein